MLMDENCTFKKFIVRSFFVLAMTCLVLSLNEKALMNEINNEVSQKLIQKQIIETQTNTLFIVNFALKDEIIKQKISDNIKDVNNYNCGIKKMKDELVKINKRFIQLLVIGMVLLSFCIFIDYKF